MVKYQLKPTEYSTLRKARKKKGWSQKTLALAFGISTSYLGCMERGTKPLNLWAKEFVANGWSEKCYRYGENKTDGDNNDRQRA